MYIHTISERLYKKLIALAISWLGTYMNKEQGRKNTLKLYALEFQQCEYIIYPL